jgi:WD repeat-containing protein 45
MATAANATLLAIPGRQTGHVQLVHLPPCMPPTPLGPPPNTPPITSSRQPQSPSRAHRPTISASSPRQPKNPASIIPAHETALTVLACPPSGRLLATTSARGTLVRVWDVLSGAFVREFRRGTDKADIFGVAFRPDEQELCVWSDKGTVHVFALASASSSS